MVIVDAAMPARSPAPVAEEQGVPAPTCPNCASSTVRAFCAECGERQPSYADTTLRRFAREAYDEFISVDGRLWRSIVALLSKPGFLAQEYFSGRRSRYMRPFSLFVLLNLLLFVAQPYTGLLRYSYADYVGVDGFEASAEARRRELALSPAQMEIRFDDVLQDQKKSMLLLAIPVFALALVVLYAGSGRTFAEHLVFSVHAYGFFVSYLLAAGTVGMTAVIRLMLAIGVPHRFIIPLNGEAGLITALAIGIVTYTSFGLRRFYRSPWPGALARAVVLFGVFAILIRTFKTLLFHTVLASI